MLILLLGAPATGKSTLAARLVERYGWARCSKDDFKERLFDTLGTGDARWSRRLSDASFTMMFAAAADRCRHAVGPLLLEGNFRPGEHESHLRQFLTDREPGAAQILCEAAAPIVAARLRARAADPTRHAGHLDLLLPGSNLLSTGWTGGFLDLPGPKLRYDSGAALALPRLLAAIDRWPRPVDSSTPV